METTTDSSIQLTFVCALLSVLSVVLCLVLSLLANRVESSQCLVLSLNNSDYSVVEWRRISYTVI
jgi:hypothetical protein